MPIAPFTNNTRPYGFVRSIVRGCITAAIFVVVATVLFAFLTTLFDISEAACMNVQAAVGIIGVFLGGLAAGRTSASRGWLVGLVVGLVFAAVYFVASSDPSSGGSRFFAVGRQMLTVTVAGLLGGILGVNL
ncbi:MAG: TIGR04086 family membrane protein [Firmicutes bacterium]|jgi:putative membrane protein (TIGR04086 family)|nr:TIGR04086 family membrane protein [Bacillota bacterium]